ncbi:hypothetical protein HBE96_06215 [Clostridium sp. P21]|uniref:Uncharacterized protein n=1 Tax=Clostridium muellerianum TaxID=2716538 RepID=A0A7Y0EF85_9CLOT|nr:hypothetical protein [Clostridium muellerianum]NMM62286.1 hypothetical protein [Clostridium muellerianum]
MELTTIKKECKGIADGLYDLVGIGPLSTAHFVTPVAESQIEYYINVYLDLPRDYPIKVLGDLPIGWVIHTETVSEDHLPILVIGYNETFVYTGGLTADDRAKEIIKQFENYIRSKDAQAVKSVLTLMYS